MPAQPAIRQARHNLFFRKGERRQRSVRGNMTIPESMSLLMEMCPECISHTRNMAWDVTHKKIYGSL
jgi:hypothetical protein